MRQWGSLNWFGNGFWTDFRSDLDGAACKPVQSGALFDSAMKTFTSAQAKQVALSDYIVTDPDILGGEPVFRGTRVPVVSLFEHLESDCPLDEFLENFPSVSRDAAVAVLMGAQELTLERARR